MRSTFAKSVLVIAFLMGVVFLARADRKNYSFTSFTAISVSGGINVKISQGSTESITAEGSTEALAELDIQKENNGLRIRRLPDSYTKKWLSGFRNKPITVFIMVRQLGNIAISGGSMVEFTSTLRIPQLSVILSGGSVVNAMVDSESLSCSLSGGSRAKFIGKATYFSVQSSGGSTSNAANLTSSAITASASGGSTMELYATRNLTVAGSGGSTIRYRGNPIVQSSVNHSAVLTHIN